MDSIYIGLQLKLGEDEDGVALEQGLHEHDDGAVDVEHGQDGQDDLPVIKVTQQAPASIQKNEYAGKEGAPPLLFHTKCIYKNPF